MSTARTVDLLEFVRSEKPLRVDREKGIIFGCKVLGEKSANPPPNNNDYPRSTREAVAATMNGARCYVDHGPKDRQGQTRSYRDAYGVHKNVREEGDGLYSDYHFPPDTETAKQLFWDAENAPNRLGFSISSRGTVESRNGRQVVTAINFDPATDSIDLVSRPATTRGLHESLEPPMKRKLKDLIESLKSSRPGYSRALKEQAEAGLVSPESEMEEPAATGGDEPADREAALKQGFRAAILACLDDDSLDLKAKVKKIKEILTMEEKMLAKGEGGGSEPPAETPAEESRKRAAGDDRVALLEAKELVRTAADEAGVKVPRPVLDNLRPGLTEAQAKALVESLKSHQPKPPKSAAPWRPDDGQRHGNGKTVEESADPPKDPKELGRWLEE